ncbi:MAG: S8 family peptidase [Paracoccaceae bacterium]
MSDGPAACRTLPPGLTPRALMVLASLLALAACKGGGSVSLGQSGPGGAGALGSYYVQSFTPYESAAAALRNSAKYLLQSSTWHLVDSLGNPISPNYNSYPLASVHAEYAHAVGLTGKGQTVAVADTRINPTHEVFAGKTLTIDSNGALTGTSADDHGTKVSSIIAGQSPGFIGIAPKANLVFGSFSSNTTLASITNLALNMNAVAQNNSWGYDGLPVSVAGLGIAFSGASGANYLTALDNYAAKGVVVFALSNDQTHTQATIMDALPAVRPSLEPGWLAVGNAVPTFSGQHVSSVQLLSAPCYEAAAWCLLADGAWTAATGTSNTGYGFGTGSSFAAPQVSGALALLAEAFPKLTPHDLRLRLLASADNGFFTPDATLAITPTFSHGYSNTYGHGFLDIRAALLPIGGTSMSLADGSVQQTNAPMIMSGAALGDAVQRSIQNVQVAVTDSLSGDFKMPGQALLATVQPAPLSRTLMAQALTDDLERIRLGSASLSGQPFAAFQGRTVAVLDPTGSFTASVLMPDRGSAEQSYGIDVKQALTDGATRLDLGLKLTHDGGSVMGFGRADDGGGGTQMASLELGLTQDIGRGGFVTLSGEVGLASLGSQAALSDVSQAVFNSVNLDIGQHDMFTDGDRLSLGVGMPVAVTSGSARLVVPVVHDLGTSSFDSVGLDLAPEHRQVNLALTYQRPLAEGSELMLQLVHADNFGNRAGQSDLAGLVAMQFSF